MGKLIRQKTARALWTDDESIMPFSQSWEVDTLKVAESAERTSVREGGGVDLSSSSRTSDIETPSGAVALNGRGVNDEGSGVAADMAVGGKPLRSRRSGSSSSVGWARKSLLRGEGGVGGGGIGQPSVYHALVVIFLEFF